MSSQRIFLLGMPGSGKSTLGRKLAQSLSIDFIDLDEEIVSYEDRNISEIFREEGEDYFRIQEATKLGEACESKGSFVMALGGGTPCYHDNLKTIKKYGTSIFIDVSIDILLSRLFNDQSTERPLFTGLSKNQLKNKLVEQMIARSSFYGKATYTLKGDELSVEDLLKIIQN